MMLRDLIKELQNLAVDYGDCLHVSVQEATSHGTKWRMPHPRFLPAEPDVEDDDSIVL